MKIKKITLGLASVLAASTLFSCGNNDNPNPSHNHNYVEHSAVASTCAKKGNEEYYSCSECEKIFTKNGDSYTEIESIPSIDFDSMNHEGTVEILVSGYNSNYEIGESIDTKFLKVIEKCEKCEGHTIPASFYEIQYPTAGENKFVAADVGSNKTVVIKYQNYTKEFSVTVSKKINEISGLPAIISKKCGDKPFSSFEGVTSSSGGEIVFKFAETEDGEYKTAGELGDDYKFIVKSGESTTYYYKAIDAGNDEYNEVIKTGTILVEHNEDFDLKVLNYKEQYKIGESFTLDGASFELKCCDDCEGVTVDASKVDWKIQNDEKRSFGEQDAGKTINIEVSYETYKKVVEVTVFAKSVVGLKDLEGHCGFEVFDHLDDVHVADGLGNPTYSFSDTMDGEYKTKDQLTVDVFDVPEGETSRVIYFKTYLKGNDTFDDFEEIHTITLTHNYGWDTSDEKVDVFGCACSDPYEFDKFIENSQDVILSADKISISLEETSYDSAKDTVKSIVIKNANPDGEIPDVSLGTDLTDLDFSNVPATTFGEQMIEVVVTNGAEGVRTAIDHVIEVPVVVVTDVIMNNEDSIKKVFAYKDDTRTYPITGYYVLGEDIDHSNYVFSWYSGWDSGDKNKFSGVIDGRNHTVKSKSSYSGAFGRLHNATIKNMTITDAWYHNTNGYSLLASGMINSTLENVTMKVLANNDPIIEPTSDLVLGWVCRIQFQNNTIKNCTFDASGKIVSRLFSTNNSTSNNTIENSTFKCDQFYSLYKHYQLGDIYHLDGLTVEGNIYSTLAKQIVTVYEDKSVTSSIALTGDRFENATVNSITLGKYDLGNNIAALAFSDEAIADESIRGDQNLILNVTINESTFNYSLPVTVKFKSAYVEDTLTTKQYILTEDETTSLSLAGTAYEGGTVESIKLAGESLGTNLSSITLPSSIKNDKAKHGDAIADVLVEVDSVKYLVHIPVLVVTKAISQYSEFSAIFSKQYAPGDWVEGSYILTADISTSTNVNSTVSDGIALVSSTNITDRGFKGVFDGCGHKISVTGAAKIYNYGYFCALNGATLRNTTFDVVWNNGGIAGRINSSTLENLTFNVLADTNRGYGIISAQHLKNNVCKNITINASGHSIYNLLGGYYDKNNNPSTFENVVVTAKEIKFIGDNSYWGEGTATMPEGITFFQEKDVEMNSQDLDASAEKVSLSLAGTDYASDEASVTSVKVAGYELGSNLSELVIPAELKSNKTLHGETSAKISLTHNGNKEVIYVPVVLATAIITSSNYELIVPHGDADHIQTEAIKGYYVIAEDFTVDDSVCFKWFSGWDSGDNFKFSGTVDGRNHKITSKSRYSGVFGNLYNATIKNLTVQDAWYHSYKDVSLFACKMNATTLENVTIMSTANVSGDALQNAADGNVYGFVSRNMFMSNTLKNCTIDITTNGNFSYVFATNNCNDNTFVDCELVCNQYFGLYKHYQTGNVTTKDGLTITGTTYTI